MKSHMSRRIHDWNSLLDPILFISQYELREVDLETMGAEKCKITEWTSDRLATRRWPNNTYCRLCCHTLETSFHLLTDCRFTRKIMEILANWSVCEQLKAIKWNATITVRDYTCVSNQLGTGKPQEAKLATRVVICMVLSEGLLITFMMISLCKFWGYVYSNEAEVVTYIARMIPVLAISFFIDGIHISLS
uniref:Reverse transcriptase zinc-binding domain-containing protein n=1 Tax=Oryza punctata TaxID=4537 RepID=A0A0E0M6P7_ORYPU